MRGSAVRVRHSAPPPFYEAVRSPSSLLFCVRLSSFVFPRSMMVRRAMRCEMPSVASRRVFCPLPLPFALRLSPFALRPLPFALCPSPFALRLSKLQRRGGKIKHLGQTMPCGPRFLSRPLFIALVINYIVAVRRGSHLARFFALGAEAWEKSEAAVGGQSGHLVIWSKSILDRQKTPL